MQIVDGVLVVRCLVAVNGLNSFPVRMVQLISNQQLAAAILQFLDLDLA